VGPAVQALVSTDEAQTAKSASPRHKHHLKRHLRLRPELSAWQAKLFNFEKFLAGDDAY
jgi:hypothetical protein